MPGIPQNIPLGLEIALSEVDGAAHKFSMIGAAEQVEILLRANELDSKAQMLELVRSMMGNNLR